MILKIIKSNKEYEAMLGWVDQMFDRKVKPTSLLKVNKCKWLCYYLKNTRTNITLFQYLILWKL